MDSKTIETSHRSLQLTVCGSGHWLLSGDVFLPDRPGELAELSAAIAGVGANIERFAYNRSQDPNLVNIATRLDSAAAAGRLADELCGKGFLAPPPAASVEKPEITDPGGLLRVKVNLQDRSVALAGFARVLKEHRANVIYMCYDGEKAREVAEIAMATESPDEVSQLLKDLNRREYHYHVEWQGADGSSINNIIGLSLLERFLLNLKVLLPREKLAELEELIHSSEELYQTLLSFKREAGGSEQSMAASQVFTSILELATSSLSKTGRGFSLRLTGPLPLTERVSLYMLSCPTGANSYLLQHDEQYTLIDSSYGVYWRDVKQWLARHGIDPSRIRTALFTHSDADHAGWAAPLEEDCGAAIHMHPDCRGIFEHENRAYGSGTPLMALNAYYTKLINRFTDLRAPKLIRPFPPADSEAGAFKVIGRFAIADLELLVLESLGGHVPAQVFYYAPAEGLLFCGDYLIDFQSLSDRAKSTLSIARFLMTSTNSDTQMFSREMRQLAKLMLDTNARVQKAGGCARIFPGHGDFYRVDEAEAMLAELNREDAKMKGRQ